MDDYELLKFITQYISVSLLSNITQEYFDYLVAVGIEKVINTKDTNFIVDCGNRAKNGSYVLTLNFKYL